MRCISAQFTFVPVVVLLNVALAPALAHGQSNGSLVVPPESQLFGRSFEDWNVLHNQWTIASGLGGATDLDDSVRRVTFLPANFTGDPAPEAHVTIAPGTFLLSAPVFVFGERYDDPNVSDDDPIALADLLAEIFADVNIQVTLDGMVVLAGTGAELERFYGPAYFDEPIAYAEPQPRGGDLNAVAALWVTGIRADLAPVASG